MAFTKQQNKNYLIFFFLLFCTVIFSADTTKQSRDTAPQIENSGSAVIPQSEQGSSENASSKVDTSIAADSLISEPGSEEWYQLQFKNFASTEDSLILVSVEALVNQFNIKDYNILKGIFGGEIFVYEDGELNQGLVFGGEEIANKEGDTFLPLFSIYPEKKPLLNQDGKQIQIDPLDLSEVESSRQIRALIQPYMNKMELYHYEVKIRKNATELLGNNGDSSAIDLLRASLKDENDKSVINLKKVSIGKLQLKYGDDETVMDAAKSLEELKSPLALPALEDRLKLENEKDPANQNKHVISFIEESISSLKSFASTMNIVQTTFIGLSLGSILILVALGLAIIYGLMGIINMAHGEFMMIGAYTTFVVQSICLDILPTAYFDWFFVISLPFSFLVAGLFGYLVEILIIRHLYNRPLESLLATWGVSLCFVQLARNIFGDLTAVKQPELLSGGLEIAPQVFLPFNRIFIMLLTAVTLFVIYAIFNKTNFGLKLRAVTQNRGMSSCMGISVRKIDSFTFFLGTGIAGIAGWGMTLIGNVVPNMGQTYIVDSFLVVVTGGVGKLLGTISAGLGIGVTNKMLEPIFEAVYAKVIILGIIILFLQARPTGIFPSKGRIEDD